ncbi:MAG: transglycosylase SLT domain-containing protein [Myxococcota bacterium]
MSNTTHLRTPPIAGALLIVALSFALRPPPDALAAPPRSLAPDDPRAKTYRRARRMIEEDAERAYALARDLRRFPYAEQMRLELLADAATAAAQVGDAIGYHLQIAKESGERERSFRARLDAAELAILWGDEARARRLSAELYAERKKLTGRYSTRRHMAARAVRLRHDLALAESPSEPNAAARSHARDLLTFYPSERATRRPGLALDVGELPKRSRFLRAKALYRSWSYLEARQEFRPLEDHPSYGEEAKWHLAQIALNKERDDPQEAERLFGELRTTGTYAAEAQYQYARALMRQERYAECIDMLEEYVRRFPSGPRVERAYYYFGWLPYDHRDNVKAIRELQRYIDKYGRKGRRSTYVYGFLAWAYMREERWGEAIAAWKDLLPYGNPIVAGKAYYWMAYASHQMGEDRDAFATLETLRKRYPVSYYGVLGEQLRAEIEGRDARASQVWFPEGAGAYPAEPVVSLADFEDARLDPTSRRIWREVETLVALGEDNRARDALAPIYDAVLRVVPSGERRKWIHALGYYVDDYNSMWKVSAGTISYVPPAPDRDKLRSAMAYPRAYEDTVEMVAEEFGLPVYLVWAIMRQESRYKPSAISHTDAVGALQMIPKTAKLVARDLGIVYNPRTFHFPEVGFRYSAFYMRKLLDVFDGLLVPMAASYNSGPTVVARWFRRNPDASFAWLIEEFEYNEGRAYCRKVAEHMTRYIYLYEKDPQRRGELLDKLYPLSRDITLPEDVGY